MRVPPLWVEWWFFAQLFYGIMGGVLGLSLGFIGVAMLALLAGSCLVRTGERFLVILLPLALPIAFASTFIAVQLFVFQESLLDENVRPLISWMLNAVAVQYLGLRRGFLHRASMAIAVIGLSTLPFLTIYGGSAIRIGLATGISIANPNDLAAWFGFCAVYFGVVALEARRMWVRVTTAAIALACVFVVVLTVSRGPLFSLAIALLIASSRVMKRGVLAVAPLVVIAWVAYGLGVFDESLGLYETRGLEDSGRFLVWPLAIARFLEAPLTGVGVSRVTTLIAGSNVEISPHNQFLFVALAAGLVPLLFFSAYWFELWRATRRLKSHGHEDAALLFPLFVYVFLIGLQLNVSFMAAWSLVVAGSVSAAGFVLKAREASSGGAGRHQLTRTAQPAWRRPGAHAGARVRGMGVPHPR